MTAADQRTDTEADVDNWLAASKAARKAKHHYPADCLAEAVIVVGNLRAELDTARATIEAAKDALGDQERAVALAEHGPVYVDDSDPYAAYFKCSACDFTTDPEDDHESGVLFSRHVLEIADTDPRAALDGGE